MLFIYIDYIKSLSIFYNFHEYLIHCFPKYVIPVTCLVILICKHLGENKLKHSVLEKAPKRNGKTAFELRSATAAMATVGCSIFSSSYLIIIVCLLCAASKALKACIILKKLGKKVVNFFLCRTGTFRLSFLGRTCIM